ncbi:hypothetical protein Tco_1521688, partial [Tanacetum coccineum]
LPSDWVSKYSELLQIYVPNLIEGAEDELLWRDNNGDLKSFSDSHLASIRLRGETVPWFCVVWFAQVSLSMHFSFGLWLT